MHTDYPARGAICWSVEAKCRGTVEIGGCRMEPRAGQHKDRQDSRALLRRGQRSFSGRSWLQRRKLLAWRGPRRPGGWDVDRQHILNRFDVRHVRHRRAYRFGASPHAQSQAELGAFACRSSSAWPTTRAFPIAARSSPSPSGIDPKTHTQRWQAVVPNKDGIFMPGMSVRVRRDYQRAA